MASTIKPRPIYQKEERQPERPDYLAAVRGLPCVICDAWGMPQLSQTIAHHPICGRYGTRKAPDIAAIPLCDGHHQGDFDASKIAIHRERSAWVDWFGKDTEYIGITQDKLAHILEGK